MGIEPWYVVETKPRGEYLACEQLRKQEFRTLLPTEIVQRTVRHQIVDLEIPVFRGYALVSFDDDAEWRAINSTRGVKRLFCLTENQPAPLPPKTAKDMLDRFGSGPVRDADALLNEIAFGAKVAILDGPFAGLTGTSQGSARSRISVLLWFFGRQTMVSLALPSVRKAG